MLLCKVSGQEEEIQTLKNTVLSSAETINTLQTIILGYEETIKRNEDEINALRNEVLGYEEKIKESEEEINILKSKVVDLHGNVKYNEEINELEIKLLSYVQEIKSKDDEISMLLNKVSGYEVKISSNEEEVNKLKNSVLSHEKEMKNKEDEITFLGKSVKELQETIKSDIEEINMLRTKVSDYDENMKVNEEEINTWRNKVSSHEEIIKINEERICALNNEVSSYEGKLKNRVEEINMLRSKIINLEDTINSDKEEIIILQNKVLDYENKLENNTEINELQNEISSCEQTIKMKEEYINHLLNEVYDYEEKIKSNEEKISMLEFKVSGFQGTENFKEELIMLQNKVSVTEKDISKKEEEINMFKTEVSCFEKKLKINDEKINALKNDVVGYVEEISMLQNNIVSLKEIISTNEEEIKRLLSEHSEYEVMIEKERNSLLNDKNKLENCHEEIALLKNTIVDLEQTNKRSEDELIKLRNEIYENDHKIPINIPTVDIDSQTIIDLEIMKANDEKLLLLENSNCDLNILKNEVKELQETIEMITEEKNIFMTRISVYEEEIMKKNEEIKILGEKVVHFDLLDQTLNAVENITSDDGNWFGDCTKVSENVSSNRAAGDNELLDNVNMLGVGELESVSIRKNTDEHGKKIEGSREETNELKNKILYYEKTIKSYTEKINFLNNKIFNYEQAISEKSRLFDVAYESVKNVDGFNNTAYSTISSNISTSYPLNDLVDDYYIQSSDNTLNFTTLDSSSQLEQSVLISKLPQTDCSINEYDPLSSIRELSYANEELETTLTEQFINPCKIENLKVLQDNNLINPTCANNTVCEKIKALILLLNKGEDISNANLEDISNKLLDIKGILKPQEDYIIYNFCQIIENFLNKEFATKKIWNEKMQIVKETLSNLHNIKDSFLKLKNSFSSLENIASEDYETINSHLKNLFLCNRELQTENVLLREQLKVSLLSEEKLSSLNELLRGDLTNSLQAEKDLEIMTEYNKNLASELKEKCNNENDSMSLLDKIANLLNPVLSWPSDQIIKKVELIYSHLMEFVSQAGCDENLRNLGLLPFYKNLITQNNLLKQKIGISLPCIKNIKGDLTSLNTDITHQFRNLNADFCSLRCKLSEFYEKQEQESLANNDLRDNVMNLVSENRELKEELHNLRILNNDLSAASKDYSILMDKYKHLDSIIQEKDDLLNEQNEFQEQVHSFVNSLKDLYFMEDFLKVNSSFKFTDKSNCIGFLTWLKMFLNEVHIIHESLLQNIESSHLSNLNEVVSELVQQKKYINDAYNSLNSEFHSMKKKMMFLPENARNMKGVLDSISSEVFKYKDSLSQDFVSLTKNMEKVLAACHQRDIDYDYYKCNSEKSYNMLNEKYLELLHSYENIEIELKSSKALVQEFTKEKDELKKETADLNCKSNEYKELISNYEMELSDYKNVCSRLETKIIDVEREKEKLEESVKQYASLGEYNSLKEGKNNLNEIMQNIRNLNCTLKESCGDLISNDLKNIDDEFVHLKNIICSLLEVKNKYNALELAYAELMSGKNELLSKIESLNALTKETVKMQKTIKDDEILLAKDEQTISLYSKKVMEMLILLDYEEPTKIDDLAWTFIEDNINKYLLMLKQNKENNTFKLEEKILYLESQLCDAQDFKSKFSKELHMLKPDLDISYLMSLSLADLQKTMIIAIIEKEKDVIEDYEMKLALSTDRIQQLEEQQKRKEDWLQEIEKENERLTNECKQIQDDNEILKADVNLKIRKIIDLEHRITQQINGEQIKEYIKEREDSNNQLEMATNEKNTLRLSIASLNEKLQTKSIECEEIYGSLQKKAEVIFDLEKVLSKCKTENAYLEKEVQHLRESMLLNLNNFNDNKQTLESDLVNYKVQVEKLHQLLSDTQKEVKTENKSVSTHFNENLETELKIKDSLINHLAKIESLNQKIDELNSQLKQQNYKFDEEFRSQAKFIESLEKELNMANKLNATLKNNQISSLTQKENESQHSSLTDEGLKSEIISLREINRSLENEKVLLLKEKESLEQSRIMNVEKESLLDNLKLEIRSLHSKLREEEDKNKSMQEEIDSLLLKLNSVSNELASSKETVDDLLARNLNNEKLKEEVASLISDLEHCKMEIKTLIKEKEIKENQLSECLNNLSLEKEIVCSVKNVLEKTRQELLDLKMEKTQLIEQHCKNLQSQKDLSSKLNSDLCQIKEISSLQENELLYLKKELSEKVAFIEEMNANSHLEKSCPFKKEYEDIRTKHQDLTKQLEHERETFKLWKTNLEEDLHCKLLKISDLELKLKKETQCYKEALKNNSDLHQKFQESQEKFKRLEDKISMQREVYIKEKTKSEMDLQNKDKLLVDLEEKLLSVKHKCEEFSKDVCMFLEKLSAVLQVDVVDLSSAIILISNFTVEKQMLVKELKKTQEKADQQVKELKETQKKTEIFENELQKLQLRIKQLEEELQETREKAEQLEEECEELNNDIKYHENEIGNLYKNGKLQEEKWMIEKAELEKELIRVKELQEKICSQDEVILSLQLKIDNYDKSVVSFNSEKKILESEKLELERKIIDLEKCLQSLKNQEINHLDGIKREMNHLKLELFNKNKAISKLEMRLESETLPFQKKAELAERKVDELTKELRTLKQSQAFNPMSSILTSPVAGLEMSSSQKNKDKIIEKLEQEIKQLITEKSALKLLAQNRRIQINELKEQLGKKGVSSFQE